VRSHGGTAKGVAVEVMRDGAGGPPTPVDPLGTRHTNDPAQPKGIVQMIHVRL